jgi:outer membrane lipoprotein LolB
VDSTPPQSFSAGFDLHGSPQAGELQLTSPLGNTLATVLWAPGSAELRQGDQVTRRATLDELTTDLGGTALPVAALFAWLRGQPLDARGWQADLSRQPEGRVTARRTQPQPSAELRIVFQP